MTEKQFAISELLRNADKVIKSGKLEEAMRSINQIFDLDQRNVYAKAYKERIISLMEAQGIQRADAERITAQVPTLPQSSTSPAMATEGKPDAPAAFVSPVLQPKNPSPQKPAEKKEERLNDPPVQPSSVPIPIVQKGQQTIKRTAAAQEAYRSMLLEIWKDGSISPEEQLRIDSMRDTFAITHEEHMEIEHEVRITAYMHAIRNAWKKGITNFETIRKNFSISDQDQITLEPKVFQLLQSLQANGSVLVLDDDTAFLSVIKDILNDGGYYCFTAVSGEEALELLDTMTPDIVICDINFQKPHMSGFAFYEKFRSIDKYLSTPFIFLSALDQEVLIRTGKKLGADDYLTKPVDAEMLTATIEGKLRRSRELRRTYE